MRSKLCLALLSWAGLALFSVDLGWARPAQPPGADAPDADPPGVNAPDAAPDADPPDIDAPPPPDTEPPSPDSGPVQVDTRGDAVWATYHAAFAAARKGQMANARALLTLLQRDHPEHPAAAQARRLVELMDIRGQTRPPADSLPDGDSTPPAGPIPTGPAPGPDQIATAGERERPSTGARAELALMQTLNGIAVGIELCLAVECDDGESIIGLPLFGGGLALGASLGLVQDVTPGRRALVNSGTLWGAFNGAMLIILTEPELESGALTLLGAQLGGTVAGYVISRNRSITEGQVATANTVGMWSAALSGLAMVTLNQDLGDDNPQAVLLVAGGAGLLAGGLLARKFPHVSRGRTFLIDAGGIVGALGGSGLALIIGGDDTSERLASGAALVGALAGLAATTYLTRHWDTRHMPSVARGARLTLMPNHDGGMSAGLRWDL